jgi:hypothetical protein
MTWTKNESSRKRHWGSFYLILSIVLAGCPGRSPAPQPLPLPSPTATAVVIPTPTSTPGRSAAREDIERVAAGSSCAAVNFRDRGRAPKGFMRGMGLMYARAVCHRDRPDVRIASQPSSGDGRNDVLAWYSENYAAAGMTNDSEAERLRHLYVLLIGLGMQESSGRHCCGRDMSADFDTAESAEAGAFQTSWGARRKSPELVNLFSSYRTGGRECLLETFRVGATCSANDARNWGEGDGKDFQQLSKDCPAFATEYAAVLVRFSGGSAGEFGPLRRKTVEIRPECDAMLLEIERMVAGDRTVCDRL